MKIPTSRWISGATALAFVLALWARGHGFGVIGLGLLLGWGEDYAWSVALGWAGLFGLVIASVVRSNRLSHLVLLGSLIILLVSWAGFFDVSIVKAWTAGSSLPFVCLALLQGTKAIGSLWSGQYVHERSPEV